MGNCVVACMTCKIGSGSGTNAFSVDNSRCAAQRIGVITVDSTTTLLHQGDPLLLLLWTLLDNNDWGSVSSICGRYTISVGGLIEWL